MKLPFATLIVFSIPAMYSEEVPSVTLCDLARAPKLHFDKTVRLTAVFEQWTEGQYFTDERCPLSHDDQIGAGFSVPESEHGARDRFIEQLHSPEYESRAIVTVVGVLRNEQARHFYWYGSRFDVTHIESFRPAVEIFKGDLEQGRDYRAAGTYHAGADLILTAPLRLPYHHAGRIEWIGLPEVHVRWKGTVTFRVVAKAVSAAGPGRWNTLFTCKILRLD